MKTKKVKKRKNNNRRNYYGNASYSGKWTEEPKGRPIDFADKYIYNGYYSDKFDYKRPKTKKKKVSPEKKRTVLQNVIIVVCAVAIVFFGYTAMDFYMIRVSPSKNASSVSGDSSQTPNLNSIDMFFNACFVQTQTLDNASKLESLIKYCTDGSYSSAVFDVKRADGTVAYNSELTLVKSENAVSQPAAEFSKSAMALYANDITPIARVYCYEDGIMPKINTSSAILNDFDASVYIDKNGETYLNPDSADAYNYIKSIIEEVRANGVKIFVLDGFDFPAGMVDANRDYYTELVNKLVADLGTDIKFYRAVAVNDVSYISENAKSDEFYFVNTSDEKAVKELEKIPNISYSVVK